MNEQIPPTRWELIGEGHHGYADRFTALIVAGEDIDGEARLADVLAPRPARILDAGAGIGRVGAALRKRGHDVTAVEKDTDLIALAAELFPDLPMIESDILGLSTEMLEGHGAPPSYDVITLVGNVMILLAEDTEVRALSVLAELLAPDGQILVGFHSLGGPAQGREYPWAEFVADARSAGLQVVHRFGGFALEPVNDAYVVAVLNRA